MADVAEQLVAGSYIATRTDRFATEVIRTDGGATFRNGRWSTPLSSWDVTIPYCKRNAPQYTAVLALFGATLGSQSTFTFHDPVACADVDCVILEDTISITPNGNLVQVEFSVEEYR